MLLHCIYQLSGLINLYTPKIETGYAFTEDMNNESLEKFYTQTNRNGCSILKTLYYNPKELIAQHLPLAEKVMIKE